MSEARKQLLAYVAEMTDEQCVRAMEAFDAHPELCATLDEMDAYVVAATAGSIEGQAALRVLRSGLGLHVADRQAVAECRIREVNT